MPRAFTTAVYSAVAALLVAGSTLPARGADNWDALARQCRLELETFGDRNSAAEPESAQRLTAIKKLLRAGSHADALTLGTHLDWLSAAGQSAEFVRAVQGSFQHPNLLLEVSRATVETRLAGISEEVDETEYVSMMIQGAQVRGDARFQATVTPRLAGDSARAEIELKVVGQVTAPNNVAVRRPVVLYTSSSADVEATTRIHWDGRQFAAAPASVVAETRSQIHDAQPLRRGLRGWRLPNPGARLISRFAINRAQSQQPDAEYDASRRMEQRIGEQIDAYLADRLTQWNEQVTKSLVTPLSRLGRFPDIQARTTDDRLILEVTQTGPGGLAAAGGPAWPPLDGIVALSIHETALPNFVGPAAAGARWSDQRFAEVQKQLLGVNSYEFRLGPHPRWQVVLAAQRPVATKIDAHGVNFELNVDELLLAGTRYPYPFRVAAKYQLEPTTTVLRLERQGTVQLAWTGGPSRQPPADQRSRLSEFIQNTFAGFFLAEAYADGLQTPAGGDWAAMSRLRLSRVETQPSWLRMTFDRN